MPILGVPDARPTRGVRIAPASRVLGMLSLGLALIAFGLTSANAAAASQTDSQFSAVDGFIEAEMRALNIPGLALGIVHGDQIVHLRGFGIADPNGRAVTPQTPFVLGSTSKAFTALAVMQLVEQGKIDLDAPVRRYLAWFQLTAGGASPPVTIRNLLHHTSGLSQASGRENLADGDASTDALERNVRRLATARPTVSAETEFQYSNANYDVLGLIVQTVAGQSFENYIRTQVFAPLAMQHSFMSASDAQRAGLATGYYPWFGVVAPTEMPYVPSGLPSGFMISSAEDMTHSLIAHLNGGRYRDVALLSSEGMLELHRPVASMGPWWDYAMGWSVHYLFDAQAAGGTAGASGIPPPVVIDHDGEESTFRSYMALVPDGGWGVVALMNTNDLTVSSRFARVGAGVVPLLLERQPPPAVVYEDVLQRNIKLILASAALPSFKISSTFSD
jgi:CubicO group peptidase (beta-lactamase class C family)